MPSAGQVVWVSGRRPHSRLPQTAHANHGVDELTIARQPIRARAWAGERIPGPPALPMPLGLVNDQQPWGMDRDDLALPGGVFRGPLAMLAWHLPCKAVIASLSLDVRHFHQFAKTLKFASVEI